MMLSPDHVSALLNRLDQEFDLEGLLAPIPGMVDRAIDPATPDRACDGKLLAERLYAVSYADDSPKAFRGAPVNAVARLMTPPPSLDRKFNLAFNGQALAARIVSIRPESNIHNSHTGVAVLVVRITWEIQKP